MEVLINQIRLERQKKEWSQDQLANLIGVSRQTIHSIEKGRYTPSTTLALKLSQAFDKSVNELFQLKSE